MEKKPKNNHNWPVCPECIGLIGSIKRNWMENHSDFIISTYETMGYENIGHKETISIDTGLTSVNGSDRFFVFNKKMTGKKQLPGQDARFTLHDRYNNNKLRRRNRAY